MLRLADADNVCSFQMSPEYTGSPYYPDNQQVMHLGFYNIKWIGQSRGFHRLVLFQYILENSLRVKYTRTKLGHNLAAATMFFHL